jgi:hypothetical protein
MPTNQAPVDATDILIALQSNVVDIRDVFIATIFLVPLLFSIISVIVLQRRYSRRPVTFRHADIFGIRLTMTEVAFRSLFFCLPAALAVDLFPLPFLSPLLVLYGGVLLYTKASKPVEFLQESTSVIERLTAAQQQIQEASGYFQKLATELQTTRLEVDAQQKQKQSLRAEIDQNLSEADAWQKLNEQQKTLVINAARDAINRKTVFQGASFVIVSIVLNLAATIIWALVGSPGRDQMLHMLKH